MNDINKFCDNFVHIVCFSMIWFIKIYIMFQFQQTITFNWWFNSTFFFFKNCESILHDYSLKKILRRLYSPTSQIFLFQFFTLFRFVQWKNLKSFLLFCAFKFLFMQRIVNYDVSSNMKISCWLLIQKFCSSCLIKRLNIMYSKCYNCFYQIYTKSLCCFFDMFWNNIFNQRTFEKMMSTHWSNHFHKFSKINWWCHSI